MMMMMIIIIIIIIIIWNQHVQTVRTTPNNKLDIIFRDDKMKHVINVKILEPRKVNKKEAKEILKYKTLQHK
jgi:hypothetical protein